MRGFVSLNSRKPTQVEFQLLSLVEQAEMWAERGERQRARQRFHQALEREPSGLARLRFGEFLYRQGESREAVKQFCILLETGRRLQSPDWCAAACRHLAVIFREQGKSALATSYQQQEIAARLRSEGDLTSDCSVPADFPALANDAIQRSEFEEAALFAELGLKLAQIRNCRANLADAWGTWATVQFLLSDNQAAWRGFLKAYAGHCHSNDDEGRIADLMNLAQTARAFGDWGTARRLLIKAGKLAENTSNCQWFLKQDRFLEEANRVLAVAERIPEWN